ncbi:hypothetical protein JCM10207_001954 [Rhodosporidiobolus poonsookiae]
MTDTGRESLTDKAERNVKPDSQKGLGEQAMDTAKGAYDSAAAAVQPDSQKSNTQSATDTLTGGGSSGSGGGESLVDKAKDTLGMGGDKTSQSNV